MFASHVFSKIASRVFPAHSDPLKIPFFQRAVFLAVLLVGFAGCSTVEVEEAFKGNFSPVKNNQTINNYCQSCHIHKDFVPGEHVLKVRKIYKSPLYRNAKECRICHFIEKIWMQNTMMRKTRYPHSVNRGLFREFEQKEIKKIKKTKRSKKTRKNKKSKKSFLGL